MGRVTLGLINGMLTLLIGIVFIGKVIFSMIRKFYVHIACFFIGKMVKQSFEWLNNYISTKLYSDKPGNVGLFTEYW